MVFSFYVFLATIFAIATMAMWISRVPNEDTGKNRLIVILIVSKLVIVLFMGICLLRISGDYQNIVDHQVAIEQKLDKLELNQKTLEIGQKAIESNQPLKRLFRP